MQIPSLNPHPLKAEVKKAHLRLWQIQKAIGISDAHVCRMLNGIVPMSGEVESGIRELLDEAKKHIAVIK
jgi:hypothetical protein